MTYENIMFELNEGVGLVTFNRPKVLNALNEKTLSEVAQVIECARNDLNMRVLVFTGAGEKAFVAGADISDFPKMNPLQARLFAEKGHAVFAALEKLPIPVIACVNGFALGGGCEFAMSCDFIYASEKAKFGQPEINLGIIPGFGGTQRLSRLVGRAKAKELCMTGEMIAAREAKELGLVAKIFPAEQLLEETMKMAKLLANRSRVALRAIKQLVDCGADVDLASGCMFEKEAFGVAFASQDAKEGIAAFLEKRKANFNGTFSN
jgi:enoyl-CoA hydratase